MARGGQAEPVCGPWKRARRPGRAWDSLGGASGPLMPLWPWRYAHTSRWASACDSHIMVTPERGSQAGLSWRGFSAGSTYTATSSAALCWARGARARPSAPASGLSRVPSLGCPPSAAARRAVLGPPRRAGWFRKHVSECRLHQPRPRKVRLLIAAVGCVWGGFPNVVLSTEARGRQRGQSGPCQ